MILKFTSLQAHFGLLLSPKLLKLYYLVISLILLMVLILIGSSILFSPYLNYPLSKSSSLTTQSYSSSSIFIKDSLLQYAILTFKYHDQSTRFIMLNSNFKYSSSTSSIPDTFKEYVNSLSYSQLTFNPVPFASFESALSYYLATNPKHSLVCIFDSYDDLCTKLPEHFL